LHNWWRQAVFEYIQSQIQKLLAATNYAIGGIFLGIIVLALAFSRSVTRPLRILAEGARRLAGGQLDTIVKIRSRDEFGDMAQVFNSVGPRLEENYQLRKSLDLAMEVQQNLLPGFDPQIDGLEIAGKSDYCEETGGDYYDYYNDENNVLTIVVGDATGHGMKAGMMVSIIKSLFVADIKDCDLVPFMNKASHTIKQMQLGQIYMALQLLRINKNKMGFSSDLKDKESDDDLLKHIQPEDLLKYGLIPEMIGRIPVYAPLQSLSEEAMKSILTDPKNAILKQYKKLLIMDNIELEFDPFAIDVIVQKAMERKTGARALRSIVEEFMLDIMYDLPSKKNIEKVIVTKDVVLDGKEPLFLKSDKKSA